MSEPLQSAFIALMGVCCLAICCYSVATGHVPRMGGAWTAERNTEPGEFWLLTVFNAIVGVGLVLAAVA